LCFTKECEIRIDGKRGREGERHLLLSRNCGESRKKRVTLARWLDGSTHFLFDGKELPPASIPRDFVEGMAM
jgi:hypothetical protein